MHLSFASLYEKDTKEKSAVGKAIIIFFIKIPLLLNVGLRSRQSMLVAKKVKRVYGLVFYRFLGMNHGTSLLVATMADVGIDRLGLRAPPTIQVTQHSSTSGASKIL